MRKGSSISQITHYFKALCALMGRGHPIESLTGIPKGT